MRFVAEHPVTQGATRRELSTPDPTVSSGEGFAGSVIGWQKTHGRHDLPWQRHRDAYRIWISEVMLQQTQVGTVIPYFQRFLERFPDVRALAAASADEVLALWSGLGYYARARNLHACARRIVDLHGGRFPEDIREIAALPGIGRSTAGAIAALAYGKRAAILDGNVKRVFARCFGIGSPVEAAATQRELWRLAETLLPESDIGAYTQGLMDLGATVCRRSRPLCELCPLAGRCVAHRDGLTAELPVPRRRPPIPERTVVLMLIEDGASVLLERRPPQGIWGGLLSLPEGGRVEDDPAIEGWLGQRGLTLRAGVVRMEERVHGFTHFRLRMQPVRCPVRAGPFAGEGVLQWIAYDLLATCGLPSPIGRLLSETLKR